MKTKSHQLFRAAGVLTATTLALVSTQLRAADKSDAFPTFDSYIKVSGQAASITGNDAAYQQRYGQDANHVGAGIEELHYLHDLNKTTSLTIDGRALSGSEDYLLGFKLAKEGVGSVDVGYKSFRTFYDGVGGFFPNNGRFNTITATYPNVPEGLFVDRGQFWAEVKIALGDTGEVKLRYVNETRTGKKDSTIWADDNNTGLNYTNATLPGVTGTVSNAAQRKIVPSYRDLDERHQSLEASIKQVIGKTTANLSLLGDWTSKNNGLFVTRYPGETQLVTVVAGPNNDTLKTPAGAGAAAANWATFSNQVVASTFDQQDTDTKGVSASTVTEVSSKLDLRTALQYQNISSDFGGDRFLVANTPNGADYIDPVTLLPMTAVTDYYDYSNLVGHSQGDVYAGMVGFDFKPIDSLVASFSLRGEAKDMDSSATFDKKSKPRTSDPRVTPVKVKDGSQTDENAVTPVVDLRYTGVKNLALYSTASRKFVKGAEVVTAPWVPLGAASAGEQVYYSDVNETKGDYCIGANWRVSPAVTLRGEPFYTDSVYQSKGLNKNVRPFPVIAGNATNNNYELDSQYWGVKLAAIVKPLNVLSFNTQYIYRKGAAQVTGYQGPNVGTAFTQPEYDSMESVSHNISETIDWNPIEQFYMQGSVSVVFNTITTAALHNQPTAAANTVPTNRLLPEAVNNYTTLSLMAGAAITKRDDVQVRYTYYRANNYDAALAVYALPYGASASENSVTCALIHKFSEKMIGQAKVGYMDSHNETTGGNTNYRGPLAYVSLDYGL